jgi:pimeloyl-ACP methyl ester carboxylesterase
MTEDGLAYEDGVLTLRDGRELAWRWWGDPGWTPVMRFQGMPSSRLMRIAGSTVQDELRIRFLQADRPGYGGSTRKPGHGIADLADDIVELLDEHGLERVAVMGGSAGGPQALALAARYPARVRSVTVVVGAAPLTPEEAAGLVELNAKGYIAKHKSWDEVFKLLSVARDQILKEHDITYGSTGDPPVDQAYMEKPAVQQQRHEDLAEALRQGAEGWSDESFALREWDFDPGAIKASVTWWHGDDDRNAPLSAARRAVARIPGAQLRVWHREGHMAVGAHENEVMKDLLDRSR